MSSIVNKELLDWVEEVYDNYLSNFVIPICPPELDVQPEFYLPMKKEWFIESLLEDNQRGDIFRQKWGIELVIKKLTFEERQDYTLRKYKNISRDEYYNTFHWGQLESNEEWVKDMNNEKIPTKLIKIIFNNKSITYYE